MVIVIYFSGLEPKTESPNYEIAYILCIMAGLFATAGISNVTVLLIVLTGYIEAHLTAMTNEFENLWSDTLEYEKTNLIENPNCYEVTLKNELLDKHINGMLIKHIKRHNSILEVHKLVKDIFDGVIAFEFILTTLALIATLLGGLEDTYMQIPYTITQLVVDTIVGQRLIDSSILFEQAIYRCGWEHFNSSNMKTAQIILQCSQKTLKLTAGHVTYLSYVCFASIVRSVYSAYATLRQAMNK